MNDQMKKWISRDKEKKQLTRPLPAFRMFVDQLKNMSQNKKIQLHYLGYLSDKNKRNIHCK